MRVAGPLTMTRTLTRTHNPYGSLNPCYCLGETGQICRPGGIGHIGQSVVEDGARLSERERLCWKWLWWVAVLVATCAECGVVCSTIAARLSVHSRCHASCVTLVTATCWFFFHLFARHCHELLGALKTVFSIELFRPFIAAFVALLCAANNTAVVLSNSTSKPWNATNYQGALLSQLIKSGTHAEPRSVFQDSESRLHPAARLPPTTPRDATV
jgi:hypothetical protein